MIPRSLLIARSLSCFSFGVGSVIPVFGIFNAIMALLRFRFAIVNTNERWNPARLRLYTGASLALLSLLTHAVVAVLIYVKIVRDIANG